MLGCCGHSEAKTKVGIEKSLIASLIFYFLLSCMDIADSLSAENAEKELKDMCTEKEMMAIKVTREEFRRQCALSTFSD